MTVPYSKMVVKDSPKEADLEKFYQQNQAQFKLPEMRKIMLLEIDPKLLKDRVIMTQDKLQEEYMSDEKLSLKLLKKEKLNKLTLKTKRALKKL